MAAPTPPYRRYSPVIVYRHCDPTTGLIVPDKETAK